MKSSQALKSALVALAVVGVLVGTTVSAQAQSTVDECLGGHPALAASQHHAVASTANQATEGADEGFAESADPGGDDEDKAVLFMLTRE